MEGYEAVDSGFMAMFGAIFIVALIIGLAVWIFCGWCTSKIADKLGVENGWWGYIPILNYILWLDMAGKPRMWALALIGLVIPFVNFLASLAIFVGAIIVWMEIADRLGKEKFWGVIAAIFAPVGMGYLALSD